MDRSLAAPTLDPATWVDAHGDYLYRFALLRVRDRDAAEELVQDVFLVALTARHSFRGKCSERSWLTAILKRKAIDWLRKEVRRRATREPQPDQWMDAQFTRSGKWKAKPDEWSADDPGLSLTCNDFRDALAGCLDRLPTRLRQAFVLRHVDERVVEEVCKAVGASESNLWVMLHRARLRLWRCLSVNWFGNESGKPSEGRT
jgi:RNA polymerase sigma-70 factor (TIGR02943 family)